MGSPGGDARSGPHALGITVERTAMMTGDELDAVVDLIVTQQQLRHRSVPSLGDTRAGLLEELNDLEPRWTDTLRVARTSNGDVVGAVLVEWNGAGRSGIHGPWVDVDDDLWGEVGSALVDAATVQLPDATTHSVLTATVEHECMADIAHRFGWTPSEVNHVMVVNADTVEAWSDDLVAEQPATPRLRPMSDGDIDALRALHDVEFPGTYYSAADLANRSARGQHTVLIAESSDGGDIDGYVAGRIQPDGDGYIDFLAVAPSARQTGIGRRLVQQLCIQLVPNSTTRRVCLTVETRRSPARRLYESLGFECELSMVGYETPVRQALRRSRISTPAQAGFAHHGPAAP